MKRKIAVIVAMVALFSLSVTSMLAWDGVQGTTFDNQGNGWTHGGTVNVYCDLGGGQVACGTTTLDPTGYYTVTFPGAPVPFSDIFVVISYNAGPSGTPSTDILETTNIPQPGHFFLNESTNTGPNAINLDAINVSEASSGIVTLVLAIIALFVGGTFMLLRRHHNFV